MSILGLVLLALAVSLDGFWAGFAFGMKKVNIRLFSLIFISSWSIVCTMLAMFLGHQLKTHLSLDSAKYMGGALLLLLGLFTLREGYKQRKKNTENGIELPQNIVYPMKITLHELVKVLRNPLLADYDKENDIKPAEGMLLGLAVAMDASIAAFTISLMGFNPLTTPFLFGLTHFLLIGSGNVLGSNSLIKQVGEKFSLLPGFILLALALFRFI